MSVHKAITEHVNKQNRRINDFLLLDKQREAYIEEAVEKCLQKQDFTTDKINDITNQINELAKGGIIPARKLVTKEMVAEFASKLNNK